MAKEHVLDRARRTWAYMTGEDPPVKTKSIGSLRLRTRVKEEPTVDSARQELEDQGYEITEVKKIHGTDDLAYFDAQFSQLIDRGSTFRIIQALEHMIESRGLARTEELINQSDLRFRLLELVPDIFR